MEENNDLTHTVACPQCGQACTVSIKNSKNGIGQRLVKCPKCNTYVSTPYKEWLELKPSERERLLKGKASLVSFLIVASIFSLLSQLHILVGILWAILGEWLLYTLLCSHNAGKYKSAITESLLRTDNDEYFSALVKIHLLYPLTEKEKKKYISYGFAELEETDYPDETDNSDAEPLDEETTENYEEKEGFFNPDYELNDLEPIIEKEKTQQAEIKKEMKNPSEVMININEQQLEDKIARLQNHSFLSKNITFSYKNIASNKKLEAINAYEGSAQTLYEQGCKWFGFDKEKKGYFRPLQILYATLVTPAPEYYSVWFLPHSNINNSTNGTWYNFYEGEVIFQCEIDSSTQTHNKPRITFVKQESGDYVFVGIYKFTNDHAWYKDGKRYYVQAYTKICDTYPENK